jgi:hypothetical protein
VPYKDKEKQRIAQHNSYLRNKAAYIEQNRKSRKRVRALIKAAKDVPCADCGNKYPYYVMDFDHVRGEKRTNISALIKETRDPNVVLEEITKCEVVCANCHRMRTHASS